MNIEQRQRVRERMIGHTVSQETRDKISQTKKAQCLTGEKSHSYGKPLSLEMRERIRQTKLAKPFPSNFEYLSEEHKRKISESVKRQWQNPEIREKMINGVKHKRGVPKGTKYTPEHCENIRKANLGKKYSAQRKEDMRQARISEWQNPDKRIHMLNGLRGRKFTEEGKLALAEGQKKRWSNLDIRNKMVKALRLGCHIKPNKPELFILGILTELYPNHYEYTGDGKVVLNGCNPDFTNINGQKKVIEIFGDYWHRGENPQGRIDKFAELGFDCLVIWERELKNCNNIMARIKEFHEKGHLQRCIA